MLELVDGQLGHILAVGDKAIANLQGYVDLTLKHFDALLDNVGGDVLVLVLRLKVCFYFVDAIEGMFKLVIHELCSASHAG